MGIAVMEVALQGARSQYLTRPTTELLRRFDYILKGTDEEPPSLPSVAKTTDIKWVGREMFEGG